MNVSGVHHPIDGPPRGAVTAAKRMVRRTLSARWLSPVWSPIAGSSVAILTLHRFAEPERGVLGHEYDLVRNALAGLRRDGYALLGVHEAVQQLVAGEPFPRRSVVFTMDDGYRGGMDACAELFGAFDCPLTVFLATGFVDRTCWLWWDQIEWVCLTSGRPSLTVDWSGRRVQLDLSTRRSVIVSILEVCEWAKTLPDEEKWEFIAALASVGGVPIPAEAPPDYAALTWEEARTLERRGIRFGPHTVTHPVLPRTSDAAAAWELATSWARVAAELAHPVPVFSYPNGSYGAREVSLLRATGLSGALTTRPAYARRGNADGAWAFELPRFGYPEQPDPVRAIASGFASVELAVQEALAR